MLDRSVLGKKVSGTEKTVSENDEERVVPIENGDFIVQAQLLSM
jgi:hypothetical protein